MFPRRNLAQSCKRLIQTRKHIIGCSVNGFPSRVYHFSTEQNPGHKDFEPKKKVQPKGAFQKYYPTIEEYLAKDKVVLFMKGTKERPECGFSRQVVLILQEYGVDYQTYNMNQDVALKEALKEWSQWPTIPQLYVEKELVGGCDIVMELHRDDELGDILGDSTD